MPIAITLRAQALTEPLAGQGITAAAATPSAMQALLATEHRVFGVGIRVAGIRAG